MKRQNTVISVKRMIHLLRRKIAPQKFLRETLGGTEKNWEKSRGTGRHRKTLKGQNTIYIQNTKFPN